MKFVPQNTKFQSAFDSILSIVGVVAIVQGWKQYNENLPKPTEKEQITRVDYMSGNYEKELKEREKRLDRNRLRGRFFVLVGSGLTVGGIFMLYRLLSDAESIDSGKNQDN